MQSKTFLGGVIIDIETFLNYITSSGFWLVLIAAGLFTFSLAFLLARHIEKRGYEQYAGPILTLGFLLITISFLATSLGVYQPHVLAVYYITYVPGMICTIVAPGLFIKKLFPERLSVLLLAAPSAAIPFLFYNCAGYSCGMEFVTIHLYSLYPVFEYFGAVMFSVIAFGYILLLLIILRKENRTEKIILVPILAALCVFSYYFSPAACAFPATAYLYIALKENGIYTGLKSTIFLYVSAGIIALLLPVLYKNHIYCVNSCTFDLLVILALSMIITGTLTILKK
ncbi:MAG: hypothetical protein JW931_07100 [Methanomicrobiaceae archaeon]|nr:hypothetical protein [Methanomicrobiaceae archaeon]